MADYNFESYYPDKDTKTVKIVTRKCMVCNKNGEVIVPELEWDLFMRERQMHIQDIFKSLDADKREQIKSGIHSECWDVMFPPEED